MNKELRWIPEHPKSFIPNIEDEIKEMKKESS